MKRIILVLMLIMSVSVLSETYVKVIELSYSINPDTQHKKNEGIINKAIKEEYNKYKAKAIGINTSRDDYYAYILFEK